MEPQNNQSRAGGLVISPSFAAFSGASVVISRYITAGGNSSLQWVHLLSDTGQCQPPCVWQHGPTWISQLCFLLRETACRHAGLAALGRGWQHRARREVQK